MDSGTLVRHQTRVAVIAVDIHFDKYLIANLQICHRYQSCRGHDIIVSP